MSSNSPTVATKVVSRVTNGNDISVGPNEPLQAVQSLIQAVKTLAAQSHFGLLDSHFKDFSGLEQELIVKEVSLKAHKNVNETLAKEKGLVETKAKERETVITALQGERGSLQEQVRVLEESSAGQIETLKKAVRKVKGLEKGLEDQKVRIQHLEECLEKESNEVQKLRSEMEYVRATNASLTQKLEESNRQLEEFAKFTVPLVEEEIAVSAGRWESLWQRVYLFVESYLVEDLPEMSLKNGKAWETLRKPEHFEHRVPLPPTNSLAAKKMRIAVVSTILARSIDEHICQPTYLFGDGDEVRGTLLRQAISSSNQESLFRGVLLAILPEEGEEAADAKVEKVLGEVMESVKDLLPRDRIEQFTTGLEHLVSDARHVWEETRMTRNHFEPHFDSARFKNIECLSLGFGGLQTSEAGQELTSEGAGDEELLVVFPRLYLVQSNQDPEPVTAGTMLGRSQSLMAAHELEEQSHSPIIGRAMSVRPRPRRDRRISISSQGSRGLGIQPFLE